MPKTSSRPGSDPAGPARLIRVALAAPLHKPLTYLLPGPPLPRGARVEVPLQGRLVPGFVLGEEEQAPAGVKLQSVRRVLDQASPFTPDLLEFLDWLSAYYRHPLGLVMAAALPGLGRRQSAPKPRKALKALAGEAAGEGLPPAQARLFKFLVGKDWVPLSLIRQLVPGGDRAWPALIRKGLIALDEAGPADTPPAAAPLAGPEILLTADQAAVMAQVGPAVEQGGFASFLLHGVTGSGKTEIYLRAGQAALAAGASAIVLVPEIALTPQLAGRFRARFGDEVAILHSGLSPGSRLKEWRRLSSGQARLALGARSALFAPLADLRLIVVDEEHEPSYKQEDGLRYQARDAALMRGRLAGAVVLLGSATPAVVSFHNRERGKYRGLSLPRRVQERPMPEVELVDLSTEMEVRGGGLVVFSRRLQEATRETLDQGRQALLFLNRRGFATYPVCGRCGRPHLCPNCSVSLTWHARFGALICHYCGLAVEQVSCPRCGGDKPRLLGLGTERVEEEVKGLFPAARVARLDSDVPGGFKAVEATLARLGRGEIDLLVGTQILAKGHDFPGIGLVGVVLADLSLNLPDFRAAERTFQLLTQVAGRAGRGDRPGRVIVQTFSPEHYAVATAAAQDYRAFYDKEIEQRRKLFYPPFSRLIQLRLTGPEGEAVQAAARLLVNLARSAAAKSKARGQVKILGPAPAPVVKIKNQYRWLILIKARTMAAGQELLDLLLPQAEAAEGLRKVRLSVDVDPMGMM